MKFEYGLYPVITEEFCENRSMVEVLKAVIAGGVKIVQLRQKNSAKKALYRIAIKYRDITASHGVKLIINDHVDIAMAVEADGVHLGQDDLPCKAARQIAPDLIIGVSTHNKKEILNAKNDGATYINIGPIFATKTKSLQINPLGLGYLKSAIKLTSIPFSVMGGITKDNINKVLEYGAKNIAMVTGITKAKNITKTTKDFIRIIESYN